MYAFSELKEDMTATAGTNSAANELIRILVRLQPMAAVCIENPRGVVMPVGVNSIDCNAAGTSDASHRPCCTMVF